MEFRSLIYITFKMFNMQPIVGWKITSPKVSTTWFPEPVNMLPYVVEGTLQMWHCQGSLDGEIPRLSKWAQWNHTGNRNRGSRSDRWRCDGYVFWRKRKEPQIKECKWKTQDIDSWKSTGLPALDVRPWPPDPEISKFVLDHYVCGHSYKLLKQKKWEKSH